MGVAYDTKHKQCVEWAAHVEGLTKEHNEVLAQLEAARALIARKEQERTAIESGVTQAADRYALMEREHAALASEAERVAARYTQMETDLAAAKLQIEGYRAEGGKYANDVSNAIAQGRQEVAAEIARLIARAEDAEQRCIKIQAMLDESQASALRDRVAARQQVEAMKMDAQLAEAKIRRLDKSLLDASATRGAELVDRSTSASRGASAEIVQLPPDPKEVARLVEEGIAAITSSSRREIDLLKAARESERQHWKEKSADLQHEIRADLNEEEGREKREEPPPVGSPNFGLRKGGV
jgi:hypothetical protein